VEIQNLNPGDRELINQLAEWYFDEWAVPKENTIDRLTKQHADDILLHLVLKEGDRAIGTGGLHLKAGLINVHEEYKKYGPWISMLYTDKNYRCRGIGEFLLKRIESNAKGLGFSKIHLYTNSAERLYKRNGWIAIARITYKGKDTVVMEKEILPQL
jgi:GNAT superfamily N-acetyltransferase